MAKTHFRETVIAGNCLTSGSEPTRLNTLARASKPVPTYEISSVDAVSFNPTMFMKNKFKIISRFGMVLFSLCFVVGAFAQRPYAPVPPQNHGNMLDRPTPTPAATAAPSRGSKLSAKDKIFMMNAAKGGQMEVEWGKWAAQNGQKADVKKFGNRMVTDHSKANSELMTMAAEKGVKLPPAKTSGKWKSDKDYMDMMVKDHEKDLAEFQEEAQNGSDPDLKKWADKTSQTVKKHLDLAKKTQSELK
jgi:putative membrane protein